MKMLFLRSVSPAGLLEKPVTDALSYPSSVGTLNVAHFTDCS